jgi:hypothetical protein
VSPDVPRQKCSFDLSTALARELRIACAIDGVTQRDVVERLVTSWLAERRARAAA